MRQQQRSGGSSSSCQRLCLVLLILPGWASGQWSSQAYGYNQPQLAAFYGRPQLLQQQQRQRQYLSAAQSIWGGAPIVVSDNILETPQPGYLPDSAAAPTRAPNHNYNNVVAGYQYEPQTELLSADGAQDAVVHIGGQRLAQPRPASNYYEPALPLQRSGDFASKFTQHYADYLRKFPRRLRPFYAYNNIDDK